MSAESLQFKGLTSAQISALISIYAQPLNTALLLAGKAGGQTAYGGIAAGENLNLNSTAHATKGNITLGSFATFDEVNKRIGVNVSAPSADIHVKSLTSGVVSEIRLQSNGEKANLGYYDSGNNLILTLGMSGDPIASRQWFVNFASPTGVRSADDDWAVFRFGGGNNKVAFGDNGVDAFFQTSHAMYFRAGATTNAYVAPSLVLNSSLSRVAVGHAQAAARLDVVGSDATTSNFALILRSLSLELITADADRTMLTANNWTLNTGWTQTVTGIQHTPGNIADLVLSNAFLTASQIVSGDRYIEGFTISGWTVGTLTTKLGTALSAEGVTQANGVYARFITANANDSNIILTPSTDFDGTVSTFTIKRMPIIDKIDDVGNLYLAGGAKILPLADSTTALNIANAAGTSFVTFDTTNNRLLVGTGTVRSRLHVRDGQIANDTTAEFALTKFNSQGVAWTADATLPSFIFNGAAAQRPEISWIRGGRNYPEFSIREHTTADHGAEFYTGAGTAAPTLTMTMDLGNIGVGLLAGTTPLGRFHVNVTDAVTGAVTNTVIVGHNSSGTPTAGYGTGIQILGQSSTTADRQMATLQATWTNPTDASRTSSLIISLQNSTAAFTVATLAANGSALAASDAATNTVTNTLSIYHNSSGTPAAGYGTGFQLLGNSDTTANRSMARLRTTWTTATDASRVSNLILSVFNIAAEVDVLTMTPTLGSTFVGADVGTANILNTLTLGHTSSGTSAAGFGVGLVLAGQNSDGTSRQMARVRSTWVDPIAASRVSNLVLSVQNVATEVDVLTLTPTSATWSGSITSVTMAFTGADKSLRFVNSVGTSTISDINTSGILAIIGVGGLTLSGNNQSVTLITSSTPRLTISSAGLLSIWDGGNLSLGTTTGTIIGTATSQRLSLWNATPNVQPTTAITAAAFVANTSGTLNDSATFGGYTIGQVVAALKRIGALA